MLTFRIVRAHALFALVNDVNNSFGSYPLHIFSDLARFVLTVGVPVAFIAYLPATVLLGRTGELSVHPALAYGVPLVGAAMFGVAFLFWRSQIILAKPDQALSELRSLTRSGGQGRSELDDVA